MNLSYAGTHLTNGKAANGSACVRGFDQAGFIMGTSASLFNVGFYLLLLRGGSQFGSKYSTLRTTLFKGFRPLIVTPWSTFSSGSCAPCARAGTMLRTGRTRSMASRVIPTRIQRLHGLNSSTVLPMGKTFLMALYSSNRAGWMSLSPSRAVRTTRTTGQSVLPRFILGSDVN